MRLEGILSVTVTPFDAQGNVDHEAYDRLLDFVLANGVHCIMPCGTTGEYYALTHEERLSVMELVAKRVAGSAKLYAGTNATTTR